MASLRLTFPEKDQPTVIALTGARLTIGRLPFNTIQIIDRTVSGFHAELISEHGHYRLHDRGSSNGTYVNGQRVSDYHLNEACTIGFGTVEAQFSPEEIASSEEAETFPSRGEVNAVRQENAEMRATVAVLREEIEALRKTHASAGGPGETVQREDYDKVVVEREALKEARLRNEEENNRLKTDLAILKRDRLNLQLAYDGSQREVEQLRRKMNGGEEETALRPVEAATVVASLADEVRIEVPKPLANVTPEVVPFEPVAPSAPSAPLVPPEEPAPMKTEIPAPQRTPAPEEAEPETIIAPAASLPKPAEPPAPAPVAPAPMTPPAFQKPSRPSVPAIPADLPRKTVPLPSKSAGIPDMIFTRAPKNGGDSGVQPAPRPSTCRGAARGRATGWPQNESVDGQGPEAAAAAAADSVADEEDESASGPAAETGRPEGDAEAHGIGELPIQLASARISD